jgi:hypothetical protein
VVIALYRQRSVAIVQPDAGSPCMDRSGDGFHQAAGKRKTHGFHSAVLMFVSGAALACLAGI